MAARKDGHNGGGQWAAGVPLPAQVPRVEPAPPTGRKAKALEKGAISETETQMSLPLETVQKMRAEMKRIGLTVVAQRGGQPDSDG